MTGYPKLRFKIKTTTEKMSKNKIEILSLSATGTSYKYTHKKTVLSSSGDPAHVSMPGVHRVASLLKRWVLGTHQGSIVPAHLQSYLEEFTFRFNRRTSRSRGLLFRRLLEQAVATEPVTEADITHGYNWPRLPQMKARRS